MMHLLRRFIFIFANIADPDEMLHQGLVCQSTCLQVSRKKWLRNNLHIMQVIVLFYSHICRKFANYKTCAKLHRFHICSFPGVVFHVKNWLAIFPVTKDLVYVKYGVNKLQIRV